MALITVFFTLPLDFPRPFLQPSPGFSIVLNPPCAENKCNLPLQETIKMSCHAILIFYSVYQLYIKLVDSWASTIKRTSAVPETPIESFLRLKYSLLLFRCLMLLFVSLNSVQNTAFTELSKWYFRRISCGKNDGKLLSNWWPPSWIRLGYKAKSKKVSPKYYSARSICLPRDQPQPDRRAWERGCTIYCICSAEWGDRLNITRRLLRRSHWPENGNFRGRV
jgi:hypothetical protein